MSKPRVGVVIATRDRAPRLLTTLRRLSELPDQPEIMVVDNASTDGTSALVAERFPDVGLLTLPANEGAVARNLGARALSTPAVAFSDDDSWWEPGSLSAAAELLAANPSIGLLAARTVVGPERAEDPLNELLATSPLPRAAPDLPGPPVFGFLGCAAVVRRSAFLGVGGYHPLLVIGGEETLLAYDLTTAGWQVCHAPSLTAVHHPAHDPRPGRRAHMRRNEALTAWLRRPLPTALRLTGRLAAQAPTDEQARRALGQVLAALPAAWRARRRLPAAVERDVRRLELGHAPAR